MMCASRGRQWWREARPSVVRGAGIHRAASGRLARSTLAAVLAGAGGCHLELAEPTIDAASPVDAVQDGGDPGDGGGGGVTLGAGLAHTCALRATGALSCWGQNEDGELGDGTTMNRLVPTAVADVPADAVEVAVGGVHTCVRRATGAVSCWGNNDQGQLGDDTLVGRPTPVAVVGLTDAAEVAAGGEQTCARRATGAVVCWGSNPNGQVGDDTTTRRSAPVQVVNLTDAVQLTGGLDHMCARRAGGAVVCWGANAVGQIGDGTTTDRHVPTPVAGLSDAVGIDSRGNHTCAVRARGDVVCWGQNDLGQIGDGTTTNRATPQPVVGLVGYAGQVAVGYLHSCVRYTGGTVACWGSSGFGQVGNGMITRSVPRPTSVPALADTVAIAAGIAHTCARRAGGGVVCWGRNEYGQLGDGTAVDHSRPVAVVEPR
jgi:alpha-tubulin suppressor-like RCC1 family protein